MSIPVFLRKNYLFGIKLLVLLSVLWACSQSKPRIIQSDNSFSRYVSGYTSDAISRNERIKIQLNGSLFDWKNAPYLIGENNIDTSKLQSLFTMEPHVEGKVHVVNSFTLEFEPDKPLKSGQNYTAYFQLNQVMEVPETHRSFGILLNTYEQTFFVKEVNLVHEHDYEVDFMQLKGKIKFTDFPTEKEVLPCFNVSYLGKKLPVLLSKTWEENTYEFTVDRIQRGRQTNVISIQIDGNSLDSKSMYDETFRVPAIGDFEIRNIELIENEDQHIEVFFSEPLNPLQDIRGLVQLEGQKDLVTSVEGSKLSIYLKDFIVGEKKLKITKGIQNFKGHSCIHSIEENVVFHDPKPRVRIRGNGVILPNSQGLIFPFEAISLNAVDVRVIKIFEENIHHFLQLNNLDGEDALHRFGNVVAEKKINLSDEKNGKTWSQHVIDLNKLIQPDPGSIYRVSIKFKKEYAICDCPEEETDSDEEDYYWSENKLSLEEEKWSERKWDNEGWNNEYQSWDYYSDDYSPCQKRYYHGKAVSRNILASDLGVIVKQDEDKKHHVFVSDMVSTNPVNLATVEFYDFAKQVIVAGKTNEQGKFSIKLTEKPFLVLIKKGKQRGYLKLGEAYSNSLERFDVGGNFIHKGLNGFLYAERGVWRPGDSMYVHFVMQQKEQVLPNNHPIQFELMDPRGNVVFEKISVKHVNGVYDFRCKTDQEAITGNYLAKVTIGNQSFTKSMKVEMIRPNRLKIDFPINEEFLVDSTVKMEVKWLHGTKASSLKTTVDVELKQTKTHFSKYTNYTFDSPLRNFERQELTLFDGDLDENGKVLIPLKYKLNKEIPGMIQASFSTKVFEPGGDFSQDRFTTLISPFSSYVGLHVPQLKNGNRTLETNQKHRFELVTLNKAGKSISGRKIHVQFFRIQSNWWYEYNDQNLAEYASRLGIYLFKDTVIQMKSDQAHFNLGVNDREYGDYIVLATDLESKHQTGKLVHFDWSIWNNPSSKSSATGANHLLFSTDKDEYQKGQEIEVSFPSPSNGRALISIENRARVLESYWVNTQAGITKYRFKASAEMAPNAYVHITLIQPHEKTSNDLPIRMYGVLPIYVVDPQTQLHPEIKMLDVIRPETDVKIDVKESFGRKMTYTLALVDEGLLDITRFKTPNAWNTFYAREAHGVVTWDMYDYVIGAYAGKWSKVHQIGGDGEEARGKNPKANRFPPVVMHLGTFVLEAGGKKTHTVRIPNYVGSLRVMLIARDQFAYGSTEKRVEVRKPLMLLPSFPRVLSPEEEVELPVHVFATEKQVKKVLIELKTNDLLQVLGSNKKEIHFDEPGDQLVSFRVKVKSKIGISSIQLKAISGNETAISSIELDVRMPNPISTEITQIEIKPGEKWSYKWKDFGYEGTNKSTVELSLSPSISLEKHLNYLIQYPHGCLEQTTSGAFPQLVLKNFILLDKKQQIQIEKNINQAIKRLGLFQTYHGGFAYWPGETSVNEWGTNYAGHFLILAEKQGYSVPSSLKSKWIQFQKKQAVEWSNSSNSMNHSRAEEAHIQMQAYRLYTLALSGEAELGSMNRLREESLSNEATWRLATAYYLMGQKTTAEKMVAGLATYVKPYRELSHTFGSDFRDETMILECMSMMGKQKNAEKLAQQIRMKLAGNDWFSTQEAGFALLSLSAYIGSHFGNEIKANVQLEKGKQQQIQSKESIKQIELTEKEMSQNAFVQIVNTSQRVLYVTLIQEQVKRYRTEKSVRQGMDLSVLYWDGFGNKLDPTKLKKGSDFSVQVKIKNTSSIPLKEIAVSQLFPSGWEILNDRLDARSSHNETRYQDIRDDRVLSYLDLEPGETKAFQIRLNATYVGKYYLPSIYAETMYDRSKRGLIPGYWVEVNP